MAGGDDDVPGWIEQLTAVVQQASQVIVDVRSPVIWGCGEGRWAQDDKGGVWPSSAAYGVGENASDGGADPKVAAVAGAGDPFHSKVACEVEDEVAGAGIPGDECRGNAWGQPVEARHSGDFGGFQVGDSPPADQQGVLAYDFARDVQRTSGGELAGLSAVVRAQRLELIVDAVRVEVGSAGRARVARGRIVGGPVGGPAWVWVGGSGHGLVGSGEAPCSSTHGL